MSLGRIAVISVSALALATAAQSQTITSRYSNMQYDAVYGGGGDSWTPNEDVTETTLLNHDSNEMEFEDARAGFVLNNPERPWSADVSIGHYQSYEFIGPANNFQSIFTSMGSLASVGSTGEGVALMIGSQELTFEFTLHQETLAHLYGEVTLLPDGQNLNAQLLLQRFNGFNWDTVFNSWFLPGQEGEFDNQYNLDAGNYRILGYVANWVTGNQEQVNTVDYQLDITPIPEPATVTMLGLGGLAMARRRRRSK